MFEFVRTRCAGSVRRLARRLLQPAVCSLLSLAVATTALATTGAQAAGAKRHQHPQAAHQHARAKTKAPGRHYTRVVAHRTKAARSPARAAARSAKGTSVVGPVQASILVDADTGAVLSQSNADVPAFPASLTKLMTLYLTFEALNAHRLSLEQTVPVSARAAAQEPTKLWLKPGDRVDVRDLILGIVTRSANDAAVVLAEAEAVSEGAFAARMTATARRLGMRGTVYRNASGLPDRAQHTTARDVARLALALYRDFPREYEYFSVRRFVFRGQEIDGHNHLLDWYDGADGLKTGFIQASGFNLAASAERHDHRLIGVILGSPTWQRRDRQMGALLDRGFATLATAGEDADGDVVLPSEPAEKGKARAVARLAAYLSPTTTAEAAPLAPSKRSVHRSGSPKHRAANLKHRTANLKHRPANLKHRAAYRHTPGHGSRPR